MFQTVIRTDEEKCMGCNKCIARCPVDANDARMTDGVNKIHIDPDRCIECGECIRVCDHGARYFEDDTGRFFSDLKSGEPISVLVAPSARHNFPDLSRLLGTLKRIGVQKVYDVSFGADIATWAYLKALEANPASSLIAQPCPVVVSYIQRYQTGLLSFLAPVQSPALCAAIYLRKYLGVTDRFAFLSPCIGKTAEFQDENTFGQITYNVTFEKLRQTLENRGISYAGGPSADFDQEPCDLGFAFSRPGGLKENLRYYAGDSLWVRQVEGSAEVCRYLNEFADRAGKGKTLPDIVDVLNCPHGCNFGTAISSGSDPDDADYATNHLKKEFIRSHPSPEQAPGFARFDRELDPKDFARNYSDLSQSIRSATAARKEEVFAQLGKDTEASRHVNCFSCGYGSCEKFAEAVALGKNDVQNCARYAQTRLKSGKLEFDELFETLEGQIGAINEKLSGLKTSGNDLNRIAKQTKIISVNASIQSAHAGQYGKGFAVVASEIKVLAGDSEKIIQSNLDDQDGLINDIVRMDKVVKTVKNQVDSALQ